MKLDLMELYQEDMLLDSAFDAIFILMFDSKVWSSNNLCHNVYRESQSQKTKDFLAQHPGSEA